MARVLDIDRLDRACGERGYLKWPRLAGFSSRILAPPLNRILASVLSAPRSGSGTFAGRAVRADQTGLAGRGLIDPGSDGPASCAPADGISANDGQAAINRPVTLGSATATFAARLATLPTASSSHGSAAPCAGSGVREQRCGRCHDHPVHRHRRQRSHPGWP
jgi:hypothetical protein